jgi:hypothetical protein
MRNDVGDTHRRLDRVLVLPDADHQRDRHHPVDELAALD